MEFRHNQPPLISNFAVELNRIPPAPPINAPIFNESSPTNLVISPCVSFLNSSAENEIAFGLDAEKRKPSTPAG